MDQAAQDFIGKEGMNIIITDFDLDSEYKEDPLVPPATYFANVTKVWHNAEKNCISWQIVLDGNEGVLSDGETPVDGITLVYNNWLPKPGDEGTLSASGKSTKRQTKINMMKKFSEKMSIDMSTPQVIMENLQNQEWVGLSVRAVVAIREYQGNVSNEVKDMQVAA